MKGLRLGSEDEVMALLGIGQAIYAICDGTEFITYGQPIGLSNGGKNLLECRGQGAIALYGDRVLCFVNWLKS